jgi:hypothetical protein
MRVLRLTVAAVVSLTSGVVVAPVGAPVGATFQADALPNGLGLPFQSVGEVRAVEAHGAMAYLGGRFTTMDGLQRLRLARVSAVTGEPDHSFVVPIGSASSTTDVVSALAVDRVAGVLYVGGTFTTAGGLSRSNLVAVDLATGVVIDSWNPNPNGAVAALAIDGGQLLVGGSFTSIAGASRSRAAALPLWSPGSPSATPVGSWAPNPNSTVRAILVDAVQSRVVLGGDFSQLAGAAAVRVGAVGRATATLAWTPSGGSPSAVNTLGLTPGGDRVLIGTDGGLLVASATSTSAATNPLTGSTGSVVSLAVDAGRNTVYLGGAIAASGRSRLLAVALDTMVVVPWAPSPDRQVNAVAVVEDRVLAGGSFLVLADVDRDGFGIVPVAGTDGGLIGSDLVIEATASITSSAVWGSTMYVAGDFTTIGGRLRTGLAAIDLATDTVIDSWVPPVPNGGVNSVMIDSGSSPPRLIVYGTFSALGASSRRSLAALDLGTGAVASWNPNITFGISSHLPQAIAIDPRPGQRSLYLVHGTSSPAATPSRNVSRIDLDTGTVTAFADWVDQPLAVAVDPDGGRVYVAGREVQPVGLNINARAKVAAFAAPTDRPSAMPSATPATSPLWATQSDLQLNGDRSVRGLAVDPTRDQLVVVGSFAQFGGVQRGCVAVLDGSTGGVTTWQPMATCTGHPNGGALYQAVAVSGDRLWVGDTWTTVAGVARSGVSEWNLATRTLQPPLAPLSGRYSQGVNLRTITALPSGRLAVGGYFATVGGQNRRALALLGADGSLSSGGLDAFTLGRSSVSAVAWQGEVVWFGGDFERVGGRESVGLAAYNTVTGEVLPTSSVNGAVRAIAVDGATVYVGGVFDRVGAEGRQHLAAFGSDGGLASFAPDFTRSTAGVRSLLMDRAGAVPRLWVGGDFTQVRQQYNTGTWINSARLAAVNLNTAQFDTSIGNPNVNGNVAALARWGEHLAVGGSFSSVGGTPATNLALFGRSTPSWQPWRPTLNSSVSSLATGPDGTLYVVGAFGTVNGVARNRAAAFAVDRTLNSWEPDVPLAGQAVATTAFNRGQVWLGGTFSRVGSTAVSNLATVDPVTSVAVAYGPRPGGALNVWSVWAGSSISYNSLWFSLSGSSVNAMAFDAGEGRVALGGTFMSVDGVQRTRFAVAQLPAASVMAAAGRFVPMTGPLAAGVGVQSFVRFGGVLYAGGTFTHVEGQRRRGLASIDLRTNELLAWNPNPNGDVSTLAVSTASVQPTLFVGGSFTRVAGLQRNGLVAFGLDPRPQAQPLPFVGVATGSAVVSLVYSAVGNRLFVAVSNQSGSTTVRELNPNTMAFAGFTSTGGWRSVDALAFDAGRGLLYVGGDFARSDGVQLGRLAAYDVPTGALRGWLPAINGRVRSLAVLAGSGDVVAGGEFTSVAGIGRSRLVRLAGAVSESVTVVGGLGAVGANGTVTRVLATPEGDGVVVAGDFSSVEGAARSRVGLVRLDPLVVDGWNPGADQTVWTLAGTEAGSRALLLGGAFRVVGGMARPGLAVFGALSAPVSLGLPSVVGEAREGVVLTAEPGAWSNWPTVVNYQWQRCRDGACADVVGATSASYTLGAGDVDRTVRVASRAFNADGQSEWVFSAESAVVAPGPAANVSLPVISGEVLVGEVVSVSAGSWNSSVPLSFSYQWLRCSSVDMSSCAPIAGATSPEYRVAAADWRTRLTAAVTADQRGTLVVASAVLTSQVRSDAPAMVAAPVVYGVMQYPAVLTASSGAWVGADEPRMGYRWLRCSSVDVSSCVAIAGATGVQYRLGGDDVGHSIALEVTARNESGTVDTAVAPGATVLPDAPVADAVPTVSGVTRVGEQLSLEMPSWRSVEAPSVGVVWKRCSIRSSQCDVIESASGTTYVLTAADHGRAITADVVATNDAAAVTVSAPWTSVVVSPRPTVGDVPSVSGGAQVGGVLVADTGTWSSIGAASFQFVWQRCSGADGSDCVDIDGAFTDRYRLVAADLGTEVRVQVTASNDGGTAVAASVSTDPVLPDIPVPQSVPVVAGAPRLGVELSIGSVSFTSAADVTVSYDWQRCVGEVCESVGSTGRSYTPTAADVGARLRVVAIGSNAGGTVSSIGAISPAVLPDAPRPDGVPRLVGVAQFGNDLMVESNNWITVVPPVLSYEWQRCTLDDGHQPSDCQPIADADTPTYRLGPADVGVAIIVEVSAANSGGTSESASASTPSVLPDPPALVTPPDVDGSYNDPVPDADPISTNEIRSATAASRSVDTGTTLEAGNGVWRTVETPAVTHEWSLCNDNCTVIGTGPTLAVDPAWLGASIELTTTATNRAGEHTTTGTVGIVRPRLHIHPPATTPWERAVSIPDLLPTPDGTGHTIRWETASTPTGPWTDAGTTPEFTVRDADVDRFLRATIDITSFDVSGNGRTDRYLTRPRPLPASPPGPVRALTTQAGWDQIVTTWTPPERTGGRPVDYTATLSSNGTEVDTVTTTSTTVTFTDLTPEHTYTVTITTASIAGTAAATTTAPITTQPRPAAPEPDITTPPPATTAPPAPSLTWPEPSPLTPPPPALSRVGAPATTPSQVTAPSADLVDRLHHRLTRSTTPPDHAPADSPDDTAPPPPALADGLPTHAPIRLRVPTPSVADPTTPAGTTDPFVVITGLLAIALWISRGAGRAHRSRSPRHG